MVKFTFHHVWIAVREIQEAIPNYKNLFGYKLVSGPFDDPIQNVSVCFLSRGEETQRSSLWRHLGPTPIDRTLKKGGGTYHICYQVQDMNAAMEHLTERGSLLLSGPVPAVAFELREIAWLMTETELLVELVQA